MSDNLIACEELVINLREYSLTVVQDNYRRKYLTYMPCITPTV